MQLDEMSLWYAPKAAVRLEFVMVRALCGHGCSGLMHGLKAVLFEVLIVDLTIEISS